MLNLHFDTIKTFGKGKWEFFPSKSACPQKFEEYCARLKNFCQNTPLCLSDMKQVKKMLEQNDFFIFVSNNGMLQIVGDVKGESELEAMRGVVDGVEQNINCEFTDVANEFLDKNQNLRNFKNWKNQINWLVRLQQYNKLFDEKRYSEIDVGRLIEDLGYNGYSLHYKDCTKDDKRIYYPRVKQKLISQAMCKPLIAQFLGCRTNEIFIGKYIGNNSRIKYVIGDCISQYLDKDCKIEKVFGSIKVKKYVGEANLLSICTTGGVEIQSDQHRSQDVTQLLEGAKSILTENELKLS